MVALLCVAGFFILVGVLAGIWLRYSRVGKRLVSEPTVTHAEESQYSPYHTSTSFSKSIPLPGEDQAALPNNMYNSSVMVQHGAPTSDIVLICFY